MTGLVIDIEPFGVSALILTWFFHVGIVDMASISRRTALGVGLSLAAVGAVGFSLWPRMVGYRLTHDEAR